MRKQTMWFPNRSDTDQAVESQKQAKSLNFGFKKKRKCTIRVAKTKALINCEADLRLCVGLCRLLVFS